MTEIYERWLVCYLAASDEVAIRFDASPTELEIPDFAIVPVDDDRELLAEWYSDIRRQVVTAAIHQEQQMSWHDLIGAHAFKKLCPKTYDDLVDGTA